jgi:hypothetical protein
LPVLVILPWRRALPLEYSDGTCPQEAPQLRGPGKAPQVADLGHQGRGADHIHPAQAGERIDQPLHAPVLKLRTQRIGQALHPFARLTHRRSVLHVGDILGRVRKAHGGQIAFVRERSRGLAAIAMPVSQQQRLELLTRPKPRAATASSRARDRSRTASSRASATTTLTRSPARAARASISASRQSAWIRSPGRRGILAGMMTLQR